MTQAKNATLVAPSPLRLPSHQDRPLRVELFDDALRNASRSNSPSVSVDQLPLYPTITEVSRAYKLNKEQHDSFAICATALLNTWKSAYLGEGVRLKHVMTGAGGCGKSEVIKALMSFSQLWNRPNAVRTIAATGIAAVNVNGRTIHSALELSIKIPKGGNEKTKPSQALKDSWYPSSESSVKSAFSSISLILTS